MQVATSNFHFPDDGVDTFNLTISNGNGTQTVMKIVMIVLLFNNNFLFDFKKVEFPFLAICVNSFTSTEDFMKWNFLTSKNT